jgi:hypothetical protein
VYKDKGVQSSDQCCDTDTKDSGCEKITSGYIDKGIERDDAFEAISNDFDNLDFNEWAGMCDNISSRPLSLAFTKCDLGSFKIYAIKV